MVDPRGGPGVAAGANANGMAPAPSPTGQQALGASPTDKPAAPQETPVYKKWWFWAVVAVSAYVVYEIATQSSQNPTRARELPTTHAPVPEGGLTWHF